MSRRQEGVLNSACFKGVTKPNACRLSFCQMDRTKGVVTNAKPLTNAERHHELPMVLDASNYMSFIVSLEIAGNRGRRAS